jgi:hypothetical protein
VCVQYSEALFRTTLIIIFNTFNFGLLNQISRHGRTPQSVLSNCPSLQLYILYPHYFKLWNRRLVRILLGECVQLSVRSSCLE